mmetsp:Transcript_18215/g.30615  ORF Transcript_18215/g.30615 Transcript_18215/m.30615 type:complete len:357 (+) Transcript_18215:244-1314(+)
MVWSGVSPTAIAFIFISSIACFMRFSIFILPGGLPWNFQENSRYASLGVITRPHSSSRSSLKLNWYSLSFGMSLSSHGTASLPFFLSLLRPLMVLCVFSVPVSFSSASVEAKPRPIRLRPPSGASESFAFLPSSSSSSSSFSSSSLSKSSFISISARPASSASSSVFHFLLFFFSPAAFSFSLSFSFFWFSSSAAVMARQNSCVSVSTTESLPPSSIAWLASIVLRSAALLTTLAMELSLSAATRRARASDSYSSLSSSPPTVHSSSAAVSCRSVADLSRALASAAVKAAPRAAVASNLLLTSAACLDSRVPMSDESVGADASSSVIRSDMSFLRMFFFFLRSFLGLLNAVISSAV